MNIRFSGTFMTIDGSRIGVRYTAGPWVAGVPADLIKVRPRGRSSFPPIVRKAFAVENNSDMREDYFEADCIRLTSSHPLYRQVRAAIAKAEGRANA